MKPLTTLLLAVVLFWGTAGWAQDETLAELKSRYARGRERIRTETTDLLTELNRQYTDRLAAVQQELMANGDLEGVLAVDGERDRFKKKSAVTDLDAVMTPSELATAQQWYLAQHKTIREEESKKLIKLARTYLHYLDREKKAQTKEGDLTLAIEIKEEADRVGNEFPEALVEEEEPEETDSASETKTIFSPTTATTTTRLGEPGTETTAEPLERKLTKVYAPPNQIYVFLLKDGIPARDMPVHYRESPDGEIETLETDTLGQVKIPAEPYTSYDIMLISKAHAFDKIQEAKGGEAYQIDLLLGNGRAGTLMFENDSCTLPVLGEIRIVGSWTATKKDQTGPVLHTGGEDAVFQQENLASDFLHCWPNRVYQVTDGETTCEFVLIEFGEDRSYGLKYELK